MKADIAELWIAALESGDYKQGFGSLFDPERKKYCCLGVLCDLADKAGVTDPIPYVDPDDDPKYAWNFWHNGATLPEVVMEWSGMRTEGGNFAEDDDVGLMEMNDGGRSFTDIARAIQERTEDL